MRFFDKLFGGTRTDSDEALSEIDRELIGSTTDIYPFLGRVDAKRYEKGSMIYNPGDDRLLKIVADDIVSFFIMTRGEKDPLIITKSFLRECNMAPQRIAAYAEQNTVNLFKKQGKLLKKNVGLNSTLYTIALNNKIESSVFSLPNMLEALKGQLKTGMFMSIPRHNEINYCKLDVEAMEHMYVKTIESYNNAGKQALSPNFYFYHNSSWVTFDQGLQQVFNYLFDNKLLTC